MGYMIDPAVRAANFEREQAYTKEVRALSRRTLALNVNALNPEGRLLGRAGQAGAYQLDHIVPVTVCFEHDIPIGLAAGISNLQLIPWFVNTSRGNHRMAGKGSCVRRGGQLVLAWRVINVII